MIIEFIFKCYFENFLNIFLIMFSNSMATVSDDVIKKVVCYALAHNMSINHANFYKSYLFQNINKNLIEKFKLVYNEYYQ